VIKSRKIRWAGHVACNGERRGVYKIMMGKPEWNRLPGCRWEDNTKMDLWDFQEELCSME